MSRDWKKITWIENEKDRDYTILINDQIEGRMYRTGNGWKITIFFEVDSDIDFFGRKITPTELSKIYRDRSDARNAIVKLWCDQ